MTECYRQKCSVCGRVFIIGHNEATAREILNIRYICSNECVELKYKYGKNKNI